MTGTIFSLGGRKVSQAFFIQIIFFLIAGAAIFFFQRDFSTHKDKPTRLAVRAGLLDHLVLGFKGISADLLWIRAIQDLDYKESKKVEKGWMYNLLDAITTLDPRYDIVYSQGVVVLSIITRDDLGAQILFERGVKNLPENWEIAYKAGYHYMHELKICKRAAELFNHAADHGGPYWLHALAGRLYAKSGQYQIARFILEDGLKNAKQPEYKLEYQKRLDELNSEYLDPNNKTLIKGLECNGSPQN
jgi:hypothetical protein